MALALRVLDMASINPASALRMVDSTNGLDNQYWSALDVTQTIADQAKVIAVNTYNPTRGGGFMADMVEGSLDSPSGQEVLKDYAGQTQTVSGAMEYSINDMLDYNKSLSTILGYNVVTDVYGHGQGTENATHAVELLTPDQKQQIRRIEIGTATPSMPAGLHGLVSIMDVRDPVSTGTLANELQWLNPENLINWSTYNIEHTNAAATLGIDGSGNSHGFFIYAQQPELQKALGWRPMRPSLVAAPPVFSGS